MKCGYPDRDAVIVAYLYDDIDAAERVAFESHAMTCLRCRSELADLRSVRSVLGQWVSPEPARSLVEAESRRFRHTSRSWWHAVPAWAQVAAAMLMLGVSAAIANLEVRYDRSSGLTVRTGWSKPAPVPQSVVADTAPWRVDLAVLQNQLRSEIRAQAPAVAAVAARPANTMSDAEFERRVRVLLDETEKKQQRELAVRLAQLQNDVYAQQQADLSRINERLGYMTTTYGEQLLKQQRQITQINYQLPASQR